MISRQPGATEIVKGSIALEVMPSHPHNFAIEVLVETGAVGFTTFAAALLLLLAGGWRAMRACGGAGAALLGLSAAFWVASWSATRSGHFGGRGLMFSSWRSSSPH